MKPFLYLTLSAFLFAGSSSAQAGFQLVGKCVGAGGKYVRDGRDGKDIKPALNAISAAAGKTLRAYSCYRTQEYQNRLLKRRGCAPFGSRNCSQTTARVSAHTYTIAADLKNFESNLTKQCQLIAKGRAVVGGGGVGTYPGGDGHFDLGRTRAWNRCKGVVGGGASYQSAAVQRYRGRAPSSCSPSKKYPTCCSSLTTFLGLCS